MGNIPSTAQGQSNKLNSTTNFQLLRKVEDPHYGEIRLVRDLKSGEQIYLKEIIFDNKDAYQSELIFFNKRIAVSHPNIVRILGCTGRDKQNFCSGYYKISVFIEVLPKTLADEINVRLQTGIPFSENDILLVAENLIAGLSYLEAQSISHGDIRPENIFATTHSYKLSDPYLSLQKNATALSHAILGTARTLLSPQLLIQVPKQNFNIECNKFKADVFSLGAVLLSMASLTSSEDLYDYDRGLMDIYQLRERLEVVRKSYSKFTYDIIRNMLKVKEEERQDFISLSNKLLPYQEDIRRKIDMPIFGVRAPPSEDTVIDGEEFFERAYAALQQDEANNDLEDQMVDVRMNQDVERNMPESVEKSSSSRNMSRTNFDEPRNQRDMEHSSSYIASINSSRIDGQSNSKRKGHGQIFGRVARAGPTLDENIDLSMTGNVKQKPSQRTNRNNNQYQNENQNQEITQTQQQQQQQREMQWQQEQQRQLKRQQQEQMQPQRQQQMLQQQQQLQEEEQYQMQLQQQQELQQQEQARLQRQRQLQQQQQLQQQEQLAQRQYQAQMQQQQQLQEEEQYQMQLQLQQQQQQQQQEQMQRQRQLQLQQQQQMLQQQQLQQQEQLAQRQYQMQMQPQTPSQKQQQQPLTFQYSGKSPMQVPLESPKQALATRQTNVVSEARLNQKSPYEKQSQPSFSVQPQNQAQYEYYHPSQIQAPLQQATYTQNQQYAEPQAERPLRSQTPQTQYEYQPPVEATKTQSSNDPVFDDLEAKIQAALQRSENTYQMASKAPLKPEQAPLVSQNEASEAQGFNQLTDVSAISLQNAHKTSSYGLYEAQMNVSDTQDIIDTLDMAKLVKNHLPSSTYIKDPNPKKLAGNQADYYGGSAPYFDANNQFLSNAFVSGNQPSYSQQGNVGYQNPGAQLYTAYSGGIHPHEESGFIKYDTAGNDNDYGYNYTSGSDGFVMKKHGQTIILNE